MARAMDIVDVFKVLLDGGHIVEKCSSATGKTEYNVMMPGTNGIASYVGHITKKQYTSLVAKGIIEFTGTQRRDKYENINSRLYLTSKKEC